MFVFCLGFCPRARCKKKKKVLYLFHYSRWYKFVRSFVLSVCLFVSGIHVNACMCSVPQPLRPGMSATWNRTVCLFIAVLLIRYTLPGMGTALPAWRARKTPVHGTFDTHRKRPEQRETTGKVPRPSQAPFAFFVCVLAVCVCVCVCVWRPFLVLLSLRDQSIFIFYFLSAGRITQLYNIGFSTFGESGVVIRIEFVYRLPADIKERLAESASRKWMCQYCLRCVTCAARAGVRTMASDWTHYEATWSSKESAPVHRKFAGS